MNLVAIDIDSLPVGQPLPFALRSAKGALLAPRGYTIASREELDGLRGRGIDICVDTDEASASHRHFMNQLQQMLRKDTPLGQIAALKLSLSGRSARAATSGGRPTGADCSSAPPSCSTRRRSRSSWTTSPAWPRSWTSSAARARTRRCWR